VNNIVVRANELASYAGRKTVLPRDVAQAAVPFCITCSHYDINTNTCHVVGPHHRHSQIGGSSKYDNFCGGLPGQCGVANNATCVFSGGSKHLKRRTKRRTKRRSTGGVFDYTGFCADHPSQCGWSDGVGGDSSAQCGAGRHKAKRRTKRRSTGGVFDYTGFCADHPSQCGWSDGVGGDSSAQCGAGRRRKRRGGEADEDSLEDSTLHDSTNSTGISRVIHQRAVRQQMMDEYNIHWTASALRLLQQTCQFHLNEVVERVQQGEQYGKNTVDVVEEVTSRYKM
jgi:histone H3/H4